MNRTVLEAYKSQLATLQEALSELQLSTGKVLSSIEKELAKPENKKTTRKAKKEIVSYDSKRLLLESGFFNEEEAETERAKSLYSYIDSLSDQLSQEEAKGVILRVLERQAKQKVNDKVSYLIGSFRNHIRERKE